ncbi:hypothetical protein RclHR1_24340004 [Rhizophagus clarus]|uniref:Reverse transcriptase domain-containing protein n=1 Tax=Rhizophagus clarus TaxID=94130 RepID=A0A2Z6R260_9GLOM|nr:hypothetical protein RclHR1_24340004 [Rhizophagus clarus]
MMGSALDIVINNLVFMDDSTLISSSKAGLEHMLSITEEFYALNNTSANHDKYVLISNSLTLTTTSTILPVEFHLSLSSLNDVSSISVISLSITSSFRFLGVWFNIKGSRDFVKKQIAGKCNSFAATLRPARLSAKQVVYLYNSVLIPKLEYCMQVTHLSATDCYVATLLLIQFRFLIPVSPLMVDDWSLWSTMTAFKCDYIACTIASMTSTPFRLQYARFSSTFPNLTLPGHTPLYLSQLADKRGRSLSHKWYLDIKANTTLPDSHDQLLDRYVCPSSATSSVTLVPGVTTTQKN